MTERIQQNVEPNYPVEKQQSALSWADYAADLFEDAFANLIGFIPNGLAFIYDELMKKIPVVGPLFEVQSVETILKLLTGITIGQGIARDLGKYCFRPIGYIVGSVFAPLLSRIKKSPKQYRGQMGEIIDELSGQTLLGALTALGAVSLGFYLQEGLGLSALSPMILMMSIGAGAGIGLITKAMLLLAVNMVQQANAANMRRNVQRAKSIGAKLKEYTKQKAKGKVYRVALDLIQQMNGPKSKETIDEFFNDQYESMIYHTNQKIDRHFDYLIDKACYGDIQAQKKLNALIPSKKINKFNAQSPLDEMLDRMFNQRMLMQLKDDIDNSYDRWRYSLPKPHML